MVMSYSTFVGFINSRKPSVWKYSVSADTSEAVCT